MPYTLVVVVLALLLLALALLLFGTDTIIVVLWHCTMVAPPHCSCTGFVGVVFVFLVVVVAELSCCY